MPQISRISHIDSLRGVAVLLMVVVHAAATWNPFESAQSSILAYTISGLGGLAAPLFVTLFGWGMYRSNLNFKQRIFYCSALIISQILVNLSSPQLFNPLTPGILSLMAILVLLMPLFNLLVSKYQDKPFLISCAVLFLLQLTYPQFQGNGQWSDRVSSDNISTIFSNLFFEGTYPLFPWFIFSLFGALISSKYDETNNLTLTKSGIAAIVLGLLFCLTTFLIAQYNGDLWAHPSSEAYLTFFPANPPFIVAGLTGVMLLWIAIKRFELTILTSLGRISLTIYIVHFIPLTLMYDFESKYDWSLEISAFVTVVYTMIWIPASALWLKLLPRANAESIIKSIRESLFS